ncbi:MAG: hypothetical protein ACK53W_12650 [Gemmatimonadota bacterium]
MPTTLAFKEIIDLPQWRPASPAPAADAAAVCMAYDMRNNERNIPGNFRLRSATVLESYNAVNDDWVPLGSPALTGTFGAGAACVFHPSQGPRGTLAAGATTTQVVLSTALPAAVGINQLANDGSGAGYWIRIIGNAAGSSGKTESRRIVANTAGTTPTITLNEALTFTPASGDAYEIRSGRLFMLSAGTLAAGVWKHYDVATNSYSGNLATTNLPGTIGGDSVLVALSEAHMPNNQQTAGNGYFGQITASASSSTSITAATGVLPAALAADEYRNFQIRIIEDTTTPTAVGQRRRISGHGAGATAAFTVAAWAVTPSPTAKFVVENDDDKIILFTNQTSVYNYNITANTWDTTTWATAIARGTGTWAAHAFGIDHTVDVARRSRHSHIFVGRGGASNAIDVLDIAGAPTGSWANDIAYGNKSQTFTTGTCAAYDPVTNGGRYAYMQVNGTQRFGRFDVQNRTWEPWGYQRYTAGTAVVGQKLHMAFFVDGSTRLAFLYGVRQSNVEQFSIACHR